MARVRAGLVLGGGAAIALLGGAATASTLTVQRSAAPAVVAASPPARASQAGGVAALSDATVNTSALVSPKVVLIQSSAGLGSGEIIDSRGYIVTNYHVLLDAQATQAPPFTVTLSNGKVYKASVAGTDANDDLAVLKISAGTLRPITFGDSSNLRVGQFVLAVGNPLGYSQTVTFGIVSTLGRGLPENGPATYLPDLIQTSAPINPGNSGGALVDLAGNLVGVPTLAAQDPEQGGAAQGIGFAIPANRVRFITDQIIKSGRVINTGRAYLGISGQDITPNVQQQYNLQVDHGVLLARVGSGTPAARAGLRVGDIIVSVGGTQVISNADLLDALARLQPGQSAQIGVVGADGRSRTVTVTLGTLPAS